MKDLYFNLFFNDTNILELYNELSNICISFKNMNIKNINLDIQRDNYRIVLSNLNFEVERFNYNRLLYGKINIGDNINDSIDYLISLINMELFNILNDEIDMINFSGEDFYIYSEKLNNKIRRLK